MKYLTLAALFLISCEMTEPISPCTCYEVEEAKRTNRATGEIENLASITITWEWCGDEFQDEKVKNFLDTEDEIVVDEANPEYIFTYITTHYCE